MFGSHQKLVDTLDAFERAARFAQNEAVLRNRIIRLAIKLDGESQSFTVQYGPDSDFVLPVQYFTSNDVSELLNDEERSAKLEKVEKAFQNVEEFQEDPIEVDNLVTVIGIASGLTQSMQFSNTASLFFYPSGEKDSAFIAIGTDEEMATLSYQAFTQEFDRKFFQIEGTTGDILEFQVAQAKKFYEEWLQWECLKTKKEWA